MVQPLFSFEFGSDCTASENCCWLHCHQVSTFTLLQYVGSPLLYGYQVLFCLVFFYSFQGKSASKVLLLDLHEKKIVHFHLLFRLIFSKPRIRTFSIISHLKLVGDAVAWQIYSVDRHPRDEP
jgi:hypothetical protein